MSTEYSSSRLKASFQTYQGEVEEILEVLENRFASNDAKVLLRRILPQFVDF